MAQRLVKRPKICLRTLEDVVSNIVDLGYRNFLDLYFMQQHILKNDRCYQQSIKESNKYLIIRNQGLGSKKELQNHVVFIKGLTLNLECKA